MKLTMAQTLALENIANYAKTHQENSRATIKHILRMSNLTEEKYTAAVSQIKSNARVALHFHPDRPDSSLRTIAEALLEQGVYKSQFETFLSNGSVSAFPGGERDLWEELLFAGAYKVEGTTSSQRPKYGALNLLLHSDGPAPRFGSCYFLLSPNVSNRCTYTYLDSHQNPREKGTYEEFDMIMAALLEETFLRDFALGENDMTPPKLIDHLLNHLGKPFSAPSEKESKRNLNHYIEAQVHGDVSLQENVEILVADPSFKGTEVGEKLVQLCQKYTIQLYWHSGYAILIDDVPKDFRGPMMPSLAKRITSKNYVDTSMIGKAVMDLKRNPQSWIDRGTDQEVLQELKLLWHVLVKYGQPLSELLKKV